MHRLRNFLIFLLTPILAFEVCAQSNPLWENTHTEVVGPYSEDPPIDPLALGALAALSVPESVSAEIVELANALDNDPVRIFEYVRNQIEYEAYYGLKKGSELTLLEGSGNDFDQCALLADLLEAAGLSPTFRHGFVSLPYDDPNSVEDLMGWIGFSDDAYPNLTYAEVLSQKTAFSSDTSFGNYLGLGNISGYPEQNKKNFIFIWNFFYNRGHPISHIKAQDQMAVVRLKRLWVEVDIDGTVYPMDPSFKGYEEAEGLETLLASAGYDRSSFLSTAGGSTGSGYVKSLSDSNIGAYLEQLTSDMLNLFSASYRGWTTDELVGGKRIVKKEVNSLNDCFTLTPVLTGSDVAMTTIGDSYKTKVRFKSGNIDYTIPTSDLKGRKVTLTFNGNTVELRLDDEAAVDTNSVSGATFSMTITVTHPSSRLNHSETKTYKKNNAFAYAILYGFSPSGRLLQERYEQLNTYLDEGKADDSREVRTELLNIMGLTWLYQTGLSTKTLSQQNQTLSISHHRFGRMSQEEGFYVDVGLQRSGTWLNNGDSTTDRSRFDNVFHLGSLYASAMEHGIIEQMQPDASAVSTVNIIRKANSDGQRIYLADSTNWNTGANVKNQLSGYDDQINEFESLIFTKGSKLLLPKNFSVSQGQWTGSGWVIRSSTQAGMIINGGYSGGYSTNYGYVSSPTISTSSYYNPSYTYTAPSMPSLKPLPSLPTLPTMYGSDPVDMASGAFIYANVDMETGTEESPRGLSFSRHYSSLFRNSDTQHMGYGWTHPLHIRASVRTATEEAVGLGNIQHAATLLVSTLVGSDLYSDDASPKEWAVTALTVGWFVDQMTDNGVSIVIGPDTFQFIKMPDGSYEPPAGSTMELTEVNGNFHLKQRHGNTIVFEDTQDPDDEGQRVQKIVGIDGHEMTFDYHNDDRINYVEDDFGRRYTFGYNSDDRIDQITDSTGRDIHYRYDSEGNLDRYTDPEGKYFYFVYEAATDLDGATPADPSLTAASEHRIVRMRNHDKEIVTQNVWDALGRVKEQYLHGDTNKTWKLSYTGIENYEENPEGGVTTYLYDERGRSVGKIDAEGNKMTMKYDGQDQVVERISGSGEITTFDYDADHNLLQVNYPRGGGSTINVYDSLHRLDHTTDPEGNLTDFVYFTSGFNVGKNRPYQIIDPEGTTTFDYYETGAGAGMVKTVTDDDGLVTENSYDNYAQPDWTDAPGDFRTDFQYTARGDLDWVEDPNDIRTDFTYNNRRQVTHIVTDKNGVDEATEERTYDNQGRLLSVESPQDNNGIRVKQSYTYNPTDLLDSESLINETATTADDLVVDYVYDGRDWADEIIDAANRQTDVIYFANGEIDETQKPGLRTSSFTYDADNRPLTRTEPGAPTDRNYGFAYGETLLADGDSTEGYPRSIFTDADSITVTTEFNRLGQPRYYRNKKDNIFEFRYDGLGRRTHAITPLDADNSRATVTTYAHRGEINTVTEPSGETATFAYHPTTGRLETATYTDGTDTEIVNYTLYDNNGNLKTLNEGADVINRTYDNLNRIKSYTDINGNTIGYRYYDSGKVAKIIYPGGTESGVGHVEYTYWKTGRLKEVIDKLDSTTSPRITTNYWNNDGRLDRIVRPNGTERKIKYDAAGRPEIVEEYTSAGQLIALYKNNYYASDELQWVYQLPKAQSSGAQPNVVNAMLYNADNQLSSFEGQTVVHDPDGNMTSGPLPDGSIGTYSFDIRNRLKSAGGITYGYDPEGERVSQSGAGGSISYVNENNLGLTKVLQRTKDGQTVRYVWGAGLLYEVNASAEATYYHYDNYGSTIALTDDSEAVTDRVEYSPFGSIIYREGTHDTPFLFTGFFGNQTDESGLVHMRARFYNPLIRRFVNADPAQQGWNWYAYAAGNPLGFVDPTGLGNASVINAVQTGLSFLGMVPVVGFVADIANAGISVARGNYADASINLAAAIPGIGQAATGAKFAAAGFGVFGAIRVTDRATDTLKAFQVGRFNDLQRVSRVGDGLDLHHVGQTHPLKQVISNYNRQSAPAIALPRFQHTRIPTFKGVYSGSPRQQLSQDIINLRRYTNAPNSSLQELIRLNKEVYPEAFRK